MLSRDTLEVTKHDLFFGTEFMQHIPQGNASISPASLRIALGMLSEGAVNETWGEIRDAAFMPSSVAERREGFSELMKGLNNEAVKCANGIWVERDFPFYEDYRRAITTSYHSEAREADFKNNAEGERGEINRWVSDKTTGKIPELFPPRSLDGETRLVLANALYFKSEWKEEFDKEKTIEQPFTLADGSKADVEMMRKGVRYGDISLRLLHGELMDGAEVVAIPYKRGDLVKLVFLPSRHDNLGRFLENVGRRGRFTGLLEIYNTLSYEKINRLELPKHELRGSYNLRNPLSSMGIRRVFDPEEAQLSRISPQRLFVSEGYHQTYFKTDEEGSEGAAATGFAVARGFNMTPERTINFVVDRPFLEAVMDTKSGAVLFLNRIEDPRRN